MFTIQDPMHSVIIVELLKQLLVIFIVCAAPLNYINNYK